MADHLAGGRLGDVLRQKADAGVPWEVVSRHLYADFGIDVTGQTLRRWAKTLGIDDAARAAS
jgi:hypothetical protein